uniref:Uncharacterized protein n=1 Tax=Aegilops tauschii subsp. strangulata TaxID=200361 RepID=A0A453B800_AEGTS
ATQDGSSLITRLSVCLFNERSVRPKQMKMSPERKGAEDKEEGSRMASAALPEPEAVHPRNKGNFKYAFTCALCASMATIVLGYGTLG